MGRVDASGPEAVEPHWVRWHHRYDRPESALGRRLAMVQGQVRAALDQARPGPIRVGSLCAGRGHDLIDIVAAHPRRTDVHARLVEFEPVLTEHARRAAGSTGLDQVEIVTGDASTTDALAGIAPVDLLLLCGIFGNISEADVHACIGLLPTVCAADAVVVWTRHRRPPDRTPAIRSWFAETGFEEVWFDFPEPTGVSTVGAHRMTTAPEPFVPGARLFRFVGDGSGA